MSNNRYHLNAVNNIEASIIPSEDATLSYTFNPAGKFDKQSIQIRLLYLALSKFDTDWASLPHSHTFTELFYITNGNGRFSVGSQILNVKSNDLIIINPGLEHTELSDFQKPMEYIVLGLEGVHFQSESAEYIHLSNSKQNPDQHLYFNSLAHELKREKLYHNFVCQNLLNIIFTILLRSDDLKMCLTTNADKSKTVKTAIKYIDDHFREAITLETLSSLVHLNKFYFAHSFTEETGISPIHFLTKKRIDESKHLLTNTDHTLSSISQIIGFSSPSYFSQSFRRITGVTPHAYRKNNRSILSVSQLERY